MLIDVHAHQFPPKYLEIIAPSGRRIPSLLANQTIEERLVHMDEAAVDIQVLSPANLTPYFESEVNANEAAHILNDGYAELVSRLPRRFKAYVSLPLPHLDASLQRNGARPRRARICRRDAWLLDPGSTGHRKAARSPFTQEMNRRRAILFFHPVVNGLCSPLLNDFNLAGSVGTTMEDTVVALHLIVARIPHRYPGIRIIVPHLGGLIPMLLNRLDNQLAATDEDLPEKPSITAKRFWYDTVGHGSAAALRCACDAFGPEHLVTGSDYPVLLLMKATGAQTFSYIREAGLPDNAAEQILHRSAAALFGL